MAKRILWILSAALACLGMDCTGPEGSDPTLPEIHLKTISLLILDAETGRAGAALTWDWPAGEDASSFEIYQSLRKDSLGSPVAHVDDRSPQAATVRIPDTTTPMTIYYGVRAVFIEPTGQKLYGRTIPVDSLSVNPGPQILAPASLSRQPGRVLDVQVQSKSDNGIILRQTLFQKKDGDWTRILDTCLPMAACGVPYFGEKTHTDAPVLETPGPKDTLECLYCVLGDESFEDHSTGRLQSLGCIRFFRTGGTP